MNATTLRPRSDIDQRYRWNAESVYRDRDAWRAEFKAVQAALPGLTAKAGTLSGGGAASLADTLELMIGLMDRVGRLYVYASMSQAVDNLDDEAQGMNGQAGALFGQFSAAAAFLDPEILSIGEERLDSWIASEPRLVIYRHYAENLFRKQAHVRSAEVEETLGLAQEVFASAYNTHDMLVEADMKFAPAKGGVEVAQGTIDKLLTDPDRETRRSAWHSYCDAHIAHENALASALTTALKKDVFESRVRRFDSSLDAALFESAIPRAAFDSTVESFRKNLPVWKRYWKVRREALGVETLEHSDIWAPISRRPPVIPYGKAVDNICDALAPLGSAYVGTLRRGCLEDRWVDVYPSIGKSSGAFSTGWKGMHPFVKMQYTDDLSSQSTLVHELGHSMHTWHTNERQPSMYADYSIFVAEVASNFNQAMLRARLFETEKDPEYQIAVIEEAMDNLHRYFFIMPTLARFELEAHRRVEESKSVTAHDLNELMADLFEEGYGGEVEVDRAREGSTWAQFSHLYMNYYVFQYATGISAAHALAGPVLAGDEAAARRYIDFLSAGSSDYPVSVLRTAGVDMTTPAAMEKTFEVLSGLVDRLERLTSSRS
ncbi:MAG: oligoendopeptidase F [Spirochaetae bacterium HGW-Spirochaetae-3]|jgi:oligoendopeptidase F|nr:MAG: oligoendopeptidase F [Spirochaetae bacterium HGW-Spirochaetae-3]